MSLKQLKTSKDSTIYLSPISKLWARS